MRRKQRTLLIPDLQGLGADTVEDRQESALIRILEHPMKLKETKVTDATNRKRKVSMDNKRRVAATMTPMNNIGFRVRQGPSDVVVLDGTISKARHWFLKNS